jgi:hypothetical protein
MLEGLMGRFKIEALYTVAGTRNYFIVADLNEGQMTELMLVASKLMSTYPEFMPLIPVSAAAVDMLGKAIEEVKKIVGQ